LCLVGGKRATAFESSKGNRVGSAYIPRGRGVLIRSRERIRKLKPRISMKSFGNGRNENAVGKRNGNSGEVDLSIKAGGRGVFCKMKSVRRKRRPTGAHGWSLWETGKKD